MKAHTVMDCGGKRSATPLSEADGNLRIVRTVGRFKSGVALTCRRSPKHLAKMREFGWLYYG